MEYYYLTSKGEENGPVTEDNLVGLAKQGKITPSTEVRNALVKSYKEAKKISCLNEVFEKGEFTENKSHVAKNLHRSASSIKPPPFNYRLMAFFLDSIVISLLVIISFNLFKTFGSSLEESQLQHMFMGSCAAVPILYYGLTLGYKAQTFGFWFFGIMVIRGEGDPVFVGRAAFSALFFILTLPLEPVLIYIFNKGLHESLAGIRVVNVRLG